MKVPFDVSTMAALWPFNTPWGGKKPKTNLASADSLTPISSPAVCHHGNIPHSPSHSWVCFQLRTNLPAVFTWSRTTGSEFKKKWLLIFVCLSLTDFITPAPAQWFPTGGHRCVTLEGTAEVSVRAGIGSKHAVAVARFILSWSRKLKWAAESLQGALCSFKVNVLRLRHKCVHIYERKHQNESSCQQ